MVSINKVLALTDCSEPSSDALSYAIEISKKFKADLIVLTVFSAPAAHRSTETMYLFRNDTPEKKQEQIREIEGFWKRFSKNGVEPEFVRLAGDPFDEIMRYSKEHSIDIIVMGTHGYTGLTHIFMGSVAEKVVRYSSIPVLTVKQKSFEYRRADK